MEEIIHSYNKQASNLLAIKNHKGAFAILMKSLKILKSSSDSTSKYKLLSLTYGNLSNLYKDLGKLPDAIKCLQALIEIEKKVPGSKYTTINAYLNLCSTYSLLHQHEIALRYGLTSIILLQKDLALPEKYIPSLVIAYHNVGVEYEYLHKYEEAADSYKKGWDLAKNQLGLLHPLTLSIKESFVESNSNKSKLPEISSYRTSSQYGKKRENLTLYSVNTNSTTTYAAESVKVPSLNESKISRKRYSVPEVSYEVRRYRIDLMTQRNNEGYAATCIQAWWRGVVARKKFRVLMMKEELRKAALKAKEAFDDYKNLRKAVMDESLPRIKENDACCKVSLVKSVDEKLPKVNNLVDKTRSRVQTSYDPYRKQVLIKSNNY